MGINGSSINAKKTKSRSIKKITNDVYALYCTLCLSEKKIMISLKYRTETANCDNVVFVNNHNKQSVWNN